jgi:deoxyribodipyrimidine photo-lyase
VCVCGQHKIARQRWLLLTSTCQPEGAKSVLYWMSRDQRVRDNWALQHAFHLSVVRRVPLIVCFCLVPKFLEATERQYGFMLKGKSNPFAHM